MSLCRILGYEWRRHLLNLAAIQGYFFTWQNAVVLRGDVDVLQWQLLRAVTAEGWSLTAVVGGLLQQKKCNWSSFSA